MYNKPTTNCSEYEVGDFNPLSFIPKLKWKVTYNGYYDDGEQRGLSSEIIMTALVLPEHELVLCSHSCGYDNFSCGCYSLGFGGRSFLLDTTDPEDAIYRAELELLNWSRTLMAHYQVIYEKMLGKKAVKDVSNLLGKEAYDAARKHTVEKLSPIRDAFIEIIKNQRDLDCVSDGTDLTSTSVEINEKIV